MKKSIFNITQQIGDKILLYNTFTTSMVEMSKELYESVFVQDDFSISETSSLYSMGFLVDDSCDEVLAMENLRNEVVKNSSDKIANIIIAPTLECNAHCFYCFENGHRKGRMSLETADALIEFLEKKWNGEKLGITWFGGEPLLVSEVIDYISRNLEKRNIVYTLNILVRQSRQSSVV